MSKFPGTALGTCQREICLVLWLPLASRAGVTIVNPEISRDELLAACVVLFSTHACQAERLLARLDGVAVRRQFHCKAMEVHPDRASALGRHPAALAEAFKTVEAAYRTLRKHLASGTKPARSTNVPRPCETQDRPARPKASRPEPAPIDHFWSGPIPPRTLRMGEYLYYAGRISWLSLIRALVWQGRQRQRFGQVAARLGYLTPELIDEILSHRQSRERIGEAALRLRLITGQQQQRVLGAQVRGQRRIGDYFVQANLLQASDLDVLLRGARSHNARVACAH